MSSTLTAAEPEEPPLFTRDFALVIATQLAFGFAFSSFFLLPKYVVTELGGSPSQVGYVGALTGLAAVLASPLCGFLVDRGPRRPLVLLGAVLSVLSSLAFLGVTHLDGYLYGVRLAQGVSFTLFYVAAGTLVADLAPPARLGQALGWFGAAALLMNAIATVVAERIAHDFGWNAVFATAAGAATLSAFMALFLREPLRTFGRARSGGAPIARALLERAPVLWAALAGGAAFGAMFTFTQPFALSLGDTQIAPLFAGYTAAALVVRLAFGSLADRLGRARVSGAALAFYAVVVASTALLARGWLGVLGAAFGLAHGAFYPALNALVLEGVTREQRGSITAYFTAAFNAGLLLVTLCFGGIAERFGFSVVFLLVALIAASGCPLLWSQTRRKAVAPSPAPAE